MKNWDKLIDKATNISNASEAQYLWNYLKKIYKDPKLADKLDAMKPDEFDSWVKNMVPQAKNYFINIASKNKGTDFEKQFMDYAAKFEKSWPYTWDREQFLKAIKREAKDTGKKDKNGKPIMEPAHIGEITPNDIMWLRNEGLHEDEIPMLADKFRKEYQDKVKEQADKEYKQEVAREKNKIAKQAKNSLPGQFAHALTPDIYASMIHDIETGGGNENNIGEWLANHKWDTAVDIGRLGGTALATSLGASIPVTAGLVTANGIASDFASDHYDVLKNIPQNALAGAGTMILPGASNKVLQWMGKIKNAPLRAGVLKARKAKFGKDDPVTAEANAVNETITNASNMVKLSNKKNNAVSAGDAEKAVDAVEELLNKSPKYNPLDKPLTRADIVSKLKTKRGTESLLKKISPMSNEAYIKATNKMKSNKLASETDMQKIAALEKQIAKQDVLYPNLVNEWKSKYTPKGKKDMFLYNLPGAIEKHVTPLARTTEAVLNNNGSGISGAAIGLVADHNGLKRSLNDRIKNYGVEDWEQGLNTKDELYQEWLEKYHPELVE